MLENAHVDIYGDYIYKPLFNCFYNTTEQTYTYSKSAIETLEKVVKYVQN